MNKKYTALVLPIIVLFTFFNGWYGFKLPQRNDESVFLTTEGRESLKRFQENFQEKSILILSNSELNSSFHEQEIKWLRDTCAEKCQVLTAKNIPSPFKKLINLSINSSLELVLISEDHPTSKLLLDKIMNRENLKKSQIAGEAYTNFLLDSYSLQIKKYLFPSLYIAVFVILFLVIGHFKNSLYLYFPCISNSLLSLALIRFFFKETNLILSIAPIIIFILSFSLILHLFFTAQKLGSFFLAVKHKLRPMLLSVFTTCIGFGSLYFSPIDVISHFGFITSILVLLMALQTIAWILYLPITLSTTRQLSLGNSNFFKNFPKRKWILAIGPLVIILGSISFTKIQLITDAIEYFPEHLSIREGTQKLGQQIIGMPILNILLEMKDNSIETKKQLLEIEQDLLLQLEEEYVDLSILSMNQLVIMANEDYLGEAILPSHLIAYQTIKSKIPRLLKTGLENDRKYLITFLSPPISTTQYQTLINKTNNILASKQIKHELNGLYFQLMSAQQTMIFTLVESLLISLTLISFLAFWLFRSISIFFSFLLVNLIPVFITLILMNLFNLSLNIATVMTFSISLGIIVDNSFHLLHALNMKNLKFDFYEQSIIIPSLITGLGMSLCFSLFGFLNFLPIKEFGLTLSMLMLFGLLMDLKVFPSLILKRTTFE